MKPIKSLLDAWAEKRTPKYTGDTGSSTRREGFRLGASASNELVLQLWEALENYKCKVHKTNPDAEGCYLTTACCTLKSIREKLEGSK